MGRIVGIVILILVAAIDVRAQDPVSPELPYGQVLEARVVDGDTMPVVTLPKTLVFTYRKSRSKRYRRRWDKMMKNVVKVYPYARVAGDLIKEYERDLQKLDTKAEKKYYIEKAEENLKAEFEKDIRKMSISEGHVLIKLIDRETGHTSYDLIKELKSGFTAFMWQAVARLFGSDLKDNFDPDENERDAMIEEIVVMIEEGMIPVAKRDARTPVTSRKLERRKRRMERQRETAENG